METKRKSARVAVSLLALAGLLVFSLFAVGGSLEPSAPPGPTMKTLDEVEPRVPIHASDLPLTITEANSYYLVEDVNFEPNNVHAITIECNDVTIDLMGYTLKGPDSGTKYGIYMSGRSNVEIRNGTVRDFYYGIFEENPGAVYHRVIDVRSVSNRLRGIYLDGKSHLVKGCTASNNGTSATSNVQGIYAGYASTVTGNTANGNGNSATSTVRGIYAGYASTVTGNTAYDNGNSASASVQGIFADSGSAVTGNTASYNGFSATGTVYGIYAGGGCTVTGNTARDNGFSATSTVYGIYAHSGSTVTGNTANGNGNSATSTVRGILAYSGCTVTGNTAYDNGNWAGGAAYGIELQGYNLVDQNTAYGNGLFAGSATNMTLGVTGCVYGINVAP
jgi:hypothetical protein